MFEWFKKRENPAPVTTLSKGEEPKPVVSGGSYMERIVCARDPQKALTVSAVYRAIELRAKAMGVMPVQYQKKDEAGGNFVPWMQGIGKRINYLLQEEPNPIMSATSLWEQVTINQLQLGNGFVYIERDVFGAPLHLWLAVCGGYNIMNGMYNIAYLSDSGIIEKIEVPRKDVLHFPNTYRYQNGFWGIPTIQYAVETLSLIKTERQQALESAAKGGRVKLLISEEKPETTPGTLAFGMFNKEQTQKYAQEINNQIYEQDVVALRGLQRVDNISMTSAEMQALEHINAGYDDIARFYATPRPLLMLDTNSHYNDYSNATMEYISRTLLPEKVEREKEIARKLIGLEGYGSRRIHVCEEPLLAMDFERRAKVDQLNLQTGAKTVNEIRAEHDMASVKEGNIVYVSTNLAELGSEKLRSNGGGRPSNEPTIPANESVNP